MRDSLKGGSEGEVMKMKNGVMEQIQKISVNFRPDMLIPCENNNVTFVSSFPIQFSQLQQFGEVYLKEASPEKCYATGKGLEITEPGERATAIINVEEKACPAPVESLTCELVSETTGEKADCSVKKIGDSQYEVGYQPTTRGRHKLNIKVEGEHIKGSPYLVTVKLPVQKLGTPIKTISGMEQPYGVAINQGGEIIVAESKKHCISIFSTAGQRLRSFGSLGTGPGQFNTPRGVAVDGDGNILVADKRNHRIQKFTYDGKFLTAVVKKGDRSLALGQPYGITVHPFNNKVYITERYSNCVQILNADLTPSSSFGSGGSGNGQFRFPWGVACDSSGNIYVADCEGHRIQVFTAEGVYVRQFSQHGTGRGELNYPASIAIDSDDVVYVTEDNSHQVSVFTCEGEFLTTFGAKGSGRGQFKRPRGVAVDKNGVVYVSDCINGHLHCF